MTRTLATLIAIAVLFGVDVGSQAGPRDVAVIVNRANPTDGLALTQLRKIVLGQEMKWPDGKKIAILMTTPGLPERDMTLKIVCGMSETDFTLHFMHASFKGETADPPKAVGSSVQVRQAVAAAINAIGFIKAADADGTVKVLTIDGSSPGQPAYKLKPR